MSAYKVGRGKPPTHSRFKPGNQEWRKRRPKLKLPEGFSPGRDLKAVLGSLVATKRGGKVSWEIRLKAIVDKLIADALRGDVAAANDLLSFHLDAEAIGDMQDVFLIFDQRGDDSI